MKKMVWHFSEIYVDWKCYATEYITVCRVNELPVWLDKKNAPAHTLVDDGCFRGKNTEQEYHRFA